MQRSKFIFLRNDDVRNKLDNELITLTDICVRHKIPISHAVEPANVSCDVVDWLLKTKAKYPDLIEIMQHGYNHNLENPDIKMEFGGQRSYEDQLSTMKKGKELMDFYFNDKWSQVFTFPYGSYNTDSLRAVNTLEYKAISTKIDFSAKNLIKNGIGTTLRKDFLLGKKISYHPKRRNSYRFREISVSANIIRKYTGQDEAEHYTIEDVINQVSRAARYTNVIGILFHHRFHTDQLGKIDQLLGRLKDVYKFSTIMNLIR